MGVLVDRIGRHTPSAHELLSILPTFTAISPPAQPPSPRLVQFYALVPHSPQVPSQRPAHALDEVPNLQQLIARKPFPPLVPTRFSRIQDRTQLLLHQGLRRDEG
jgi:hypothetical protein